MRMTTRLCHSKGIVDCGERVEVPAKKYEKNIAKHLNPPAIAKNRESCWKIDW